MRTVVPPTAALIEDACLEFKRENSLVEQSLEELLRQYPLNKELTHIFLKAVAINFLYSTQIRAYTVTIPNVEDVANHIFSAADSIDLKLSAGESSIVDWIADVTVQDKQHRTYFSFASKYCSWHNQDAYPIYDIHVLNYLCSLQKEKPFCADFKLNRDVWTYGDFVRVVREFQKAYGLERYNFKAIDKFLWKYGDETATPIVSL